MGAVAVASGVLPGPEGVYVEGYGGPDAPIPADGLPPLHGQEGRRLTDTPPNGVTEESNTGRRDGHGRASADSRGLSGTPERAGADRGNRSVDSGRPGTPRRTGTTSPAEGSPSRPSAPSSSPGAAPNAPSTPRASDADVEEAAEAEVVRLVNRERARVGCRPLTPDPDLTRLAGRFSRHMATQRFFDHTAPDGSTPWDRAERLGIENLAAENIARGQRDAAAVVRSWMASPEHRANILECDYTSLGVGVHFGPGGPWWTQDFGY